MAGRKQKTLKEKLEEEKLKEIFAEKLTKICKKKFQVNEIGVKELFKIYNFLYPEESKTILSKVDKNEVVRGIRKWFDKYDKTFPSHNTIYKLCNFLNCSMDYLFGYDDCSTHDIQFVHEYTGLSENAVNNLHHFYSSTDINKRNNIVSLNKLLEEHRTFEELLPGITNYVRKCSAHLEIKNEIESILEQSGFSDIPVCAIKKDSNTRLENAVERVNAASYKSGIDFANVMTDIAKGIKKVTRC